ncbi:TonB-dependent receptor, partial [Salmonella enterica subsp. enterica serovar Montevideo]|nr:TonB-dependent receptor [Salmonella enterica subsp. enterica serovar Montevideo]
IGSPDLKPETSESWELGLYYRGEEGILEGVEASVTTFRNDVDIQSPTRTKGLNLNIPFLHEVNTTKKSVIAHNALRFACDNGY